MKTIAAVSHGPKQPFSVEDVELPDLGRGEILVRIAGVGVCHTDLASRDGLLTAPFPAIFGHEGAGKVERVGADVTKVGPGDSVVLVPSSDGTCPECQAGAPMYCDHFSALNLQTEPVGPTADLRDGGKARIAFFGQSSFACHAIASERNAVKVSGDLPLHLLGPLGCGIQTGAGTVMNGMRPAGGSSIVILGTGAVGLAALLGAVVCGCGAIVAVDRVQSKLDLARSFGATHVINTSDGTNIGEAIRQIVPRGVDYIVDSAGVPALVTQSIGGLATRGTLGLVAVPPSPDRMLDLPWLSMVLAGQTVQGFTEGDSIPDIFIPRLIELYLQNRFPFDRLIRGYSFEQINEAVEDLRAGTTIKAVLRMPNS